MLALKLCPPLRSCTSFYGIRFTSQGPLPSIPKEGSFSYKYEQFIGKWPKLLAIHRMVVDGSRWCFSDVKTYYRIRRDISAQRRTLEQLTVEELEVLVQFPTEGPKLGGILVLIPLPMTVYILGMAVIFFPRLILTRHFWTDAQRAEFFSKEVLASVTSAQPLKKLIDKDSIANLALPSLDKMSIDDTTNLARLHGLIPLPLPGLNRRLSSRSKALLRLDQILHWETLTHRQLVFHCYIRRIRFSGLPDEQMRNALRSWALSTKGLSESSYLAAPLIFNVSNIHSN